MLTLSLRKRGDEARQILARLDGADVQHKRLLQVVALSHAIEFGGIGDDVILRRGGLIDDVHFFRRDVQAGHDLALGMLRHGDDGRRPAGHRRNDRAHEQLALERMQPRMHEQRHIVQRDHDRTRGVQRRDASW